MATGKTRVWDPLIRIFHWSLVAGFSIAWLTGDDAGDLHIYSGYAVIGLITFRLLWGFVGSRYARFSDFIASPAAVVEYLKGIVSGKPRHYLGHNPAGGWMILALLISIAATSYTGLKVYGLEGHGPLAGGTNIELVPSTAWADEDEDDERAEGAEGAEAGEGAEDWWEEIHEFFANLTLFLVFVHVAGVIVSSYVHRENLVKAMLTGDKETQ